MLFGVAALAMMLFAWLLSPRKLTVRWQAGSLAWWLKGHIWLGLLSLPLVFYHSAFRWGGPVEKITMGLFLVVITSGVVGLVLQNLLPRFMKSQLAYEAIPDQLAHLCLRLQSEADQLVLAACGSQTLELALTQKGASVPVAVGEPAAWLAGLYLHSIRPFLGSTTAGESPLATRAQAQSIFERARLSLPEAFQTTLDQLQDRCRLRRQLRTQERMYLVLHGWLRVHVPVSIALAVFTAVHVVTALYF
jgi:hypothetical protein